MSLHSIADVIAYVQTHPDVPPNEVLVLMVIANYANEHGANAYPSFDTLQKTTHLARRTIRYALRGLEEKKLIETELLRGRTGRQTYRLLVPHTPLKKGASGASFGDGKGASGAPKKGQEMPLELLLTQQGEKKSAHAQDNGHACEDGPTAAIAGNGHLAGNGYHSGNGHLTMDDALQMIKDADLCAQIAKTARTWTMGGYEGISGEGIMSSAAR
jgi:hypothetical protein